MDIGKRIFPAAFTAIVGVLGINFLTQGGGFSTLFSRQLLVMGLIIGAAQLISDFISPGVRAELDVVF